MRDRRACELPAFWLAVLGFLLLSGAANAQLFKSKVPGSADLAAQGFKQFNLRSGNLERVFLVQEPTNAATPAAVVVLLHGGTQSMRKLFGPDVGGSREWAAVAKANNVLLLVPNGTDPETGDALGDNQVWNDLRAGGGVRTTTVDDVGFILALLDWAKAKYRTDPSRVFVTGASNGGMMTYRLLIDASDRFAAGAAFVAALPADIEQVKRPVRPVPLMIMNGTADPLVKWEGGEIMGRRGKVASAAQTLAWWQSANKAAREPAETVLLPDVDPGDRCRIQRQTFPALAGGAPVVFFTAQGGGHAMPSLKHKVPDTFLVRRLIGPICRDVEAVEVVWKFFQARGR